MEEVTNYSEFISLYDDPKLLGKPVVWQMFVMEEDDVFDEEFKKRSPNYQQMIPRLHAWPRVQEMANGLNRDVVLRDHDMDRWFIVTYDRTKMLDEKAFNLAAEASKEIANEEE